jgi:hypothetical protein
MTRLTQIPGNLDITMLKDNDLSFDVEMVGINLTGYVLSANIIPAGNNPTLIPITISNIDLPTGKLHFFISRTSIKDLPLITESNRWLFEWTYGGFKRGILNGYFYVQGD